MCTVAPECRGSYKKVRTITKAKSLPMRIASSRVTKDFAGYSEQVVFNLPFIAAYCTKGRTTTKAKSLPMRIASSKITKDFAGYSEQAVSQPALHSRILQKRPHMRASLFVIPNSEI
jgi:hypothetical protein